MISNKLAWKSNTWDLVLREQPDQEWLYHFTSTSGLIGIAQDKSLYSTHIAYLNDTAERLHGLKLFLEVLSAFEQTAITLGDKEFLTEVKRQFSMTRGGYSTFVTSFAHSRITCNVSHVLPTG